MNILASIIAGIVATIVFGNIGIGIATVTMIFIVIIFSKVALKSYGMHNMHLILRVARLISVITRVFHPLVILVTGISI